MVSVPSPAAPERKSPILPFLAFAICSLIWGSTWVTIKIGNADIPALNAAGLRFAISAVLLIALQVIQRAPMPANRTEWGVIVFVGVVLVGLDYGFIYVAEETLASGLSSVLFATMPLFTLTIARFLGLEKFTLRKLAGILIALAGVCILSYDQLALSGPLALPAGMVMAAALFAAASTTVTKRFGRGLHPVTLNGWSALVGIVMLYSGAFLRGEGFHIPETKSGWATIFYLAVLGSVVAFLLYYWLLKRWDASRCGMVSVATPILAVVLGTLVENEPFTPAIITGAVLVLTGVTLTMLQRAPARRPGG